MRAMVKNLRLEKAYRILQQLKFENEILALINFQTISNDFYTQIPNHPTGQ